MGSKKQRNKVSLEKVFELPQMSEEMGQPVFIRSFDDAIKAAENFGCEVIWGANLEDGLPMPFPTGEIWIMRDGHWVEQDKNFRCCTCAECQSDSTFKH